jgi:cytochrome P450
VNVWAIGRDPSSWAEPLVFRPERFLEGGANAGTDVRGQHFHMLPFGSGRRICPGASLALLVVQAALAAMVQCFEWRPAGGADKVDMEEGPGLTADAAAEAPARLRRRAAPPPLAAAVSVRNATSDSSEKRLAGCEARF